MTRRASLAAVLVVIAAIAIGISRRRRGVPMAGGATATAPAPPASPKAAPDPPRTANSPHAAIAPPGARSRVDEAGADPRVGAEADAGMVAVPIRTDERGTEVPVTVRVQPSCSWGEVDLVDLYTRQGELLGFSDAGGFDLLLTVEPLTQGSGKAPQAVRLSHAQLTSGVSHTFRIPPVAAPTPLGVFLCSDTSGQGRCRGKDASDLNSLYVEHLRTSQIGRLKTLGDAVRNHVFFFQLVTVEPRWMKVWPKPSPTKRDYTQLRRVFEAEGQPGVGQLVGAIERLNTGMRSLPPEVADRRVAFVLNHGDSQHCNGRDPAKPPVFGPGRTAAASGPTRVDVWRPPAGAADQLGPVFPRYHAPRPASPAR